MHNSNNFYEIWASAENFVCVHIWAWTIIWMWNLFIVTATNSFCQTKLKATKAGSVTCCWCATRRAICVLCCTYFQYLKKFERESEKIHYSNSSALLSLLFIHFALLILLYIDIILPFMGTHTWFLRWMAERIGIAAGKKFKIHIRVVTCQSMVVKNAKMFNGNWKHFLYGSRGGNKKWLFWKIILIKLRKKIKI
jgi:hypothetical protein